MNPLELDLPGCIKTYQSEQTDDGKALIEASCVFPKSFPGFIGHFPENPTLPAIVQLAVVRHLTEHYYDTPLCPLSYSRTKFRGMAKPDQKILITVRVHEVQRVFQGKFTLKTEQNKTIASGNFTFTPPAAMIQP